MWSSGASSCPAPPVHTARMCQLSAPRSAARGVCCCAAATTRWIGVIPARYESYCRYDSGPQYDHVGMTPCRYDSYLQPDWQQPPPSTTVLGHSCSLCATHSAAASAHVAAELSMQVRVARLFLLAKSSEGKLLQTEWQLWLRSQQRTTPNAAPADIHLSNDRLSSRVVVEIWSNEMRWELAPAGITRRAPNIGHPTPSAICTSATRRRSRIALMMSNSLVDISVSAQV